MLQAFNRGWFYSGTSLAVASTAGDEEQHLVATYSRVSELGDVSVDENVERLSSFLDSQVMQINGGAVWIVRCVELKCFKGVLSTVFNTLNAVVVTGDGR